MKTRVAIILQRINIEQLKTLLGAQYRTRVMAYTTSTAEEGFVSIIGNILPAALYL